MLNFIKDKLTIVAVVSALVITPMHGMTTEDRARMHILNIHPTDISREDIITETQARIPAVLARLLATVTIGQPNNAPLQQQMHNNAVAPAPQDVRIQVGTPVQIALSQPVVLEEERLIPEPQVMVMQRTPYHCKEICRDLCLCTWKSESYNWNCCNNTPLRPHKICRPTSYKVSRCCMATYGTAIFGGLLAESLYIIMHSHKD